MKFCDKDFLLSNETARELYHGTAASQPIIDYHCHLSPKDLAEDRQFANLHEPWLEGDHYKWRAMRANGIAERFCAGDAPAFEKFSAWAGEVSHTSPSLVGQLLFRDGLKDSRGDRCVTYQAMERIKQSGTPRSE